MDEDATLKVSLTGTKTLSDLFCTTSDCGIGSQLKD